MHSTGQEGPRQRTACWEPGLGEGVLDSQGQRGLPGSPGLTPVREQGGDEGLWEGSGEQPREGADAACMWQGPWAGVWSSGWLELPTQPRLERHCLGSGASETLPPSRGTIQ